MSLASSPLIAVLFTSPHASKKSFWKSKSVADTVMSFFFSPPCISYSSPAQTLRLCRLQKQRCFAGNIYDITSRARDDFDGKTCPQRTKKKETFLDLVSCRLNQGHLCEKHQWKITNLQMTSLIFLMHKEPNLHISALVWVQQRIKRLHQWLGGEKIGQLEAGRQSGKEGGRERGISQRQTAIQYIDYSWISSV